MKVKFQFAKYMKRFQLFTLVLFLYSLSVQQVCAQNIPFLFSNFASNGKFTLDLGEIVSYKVAIQSDGKIVIAGTTDSIFILRLLPSGILDATFGNAGLMKFELGGDVELMGLKILNDGKYFIVAKQSISGPYKPIFGRINNDGSLDQTYGVGGFKFLFNNFPSKLVWFLNDGSVLFASSYNLGSGLGKDFWLMKLNSEGALDNSFGTNGQTITDLGNQTDDIPNHLFVDGNGKIYLAGSSMVSASLGTDYGVARYFNNGQLDTSFNGSGIVTYDISLLDYWNGMVQTSNKKIVLIGSVYDEGKGLPKVVMSCLLPDGKIDSSFGEKGQLVLSFGSNTNDRVYTLAQEQSGEFLLVGKSSILSQYSHMAMARIKPNGTLDKSFGISGISMPALSNNDVLFELAPEGINNFLTFGYTEGKLLVMKFSKEFLSLQDWFAPSKYVAVYPNPSSGEIHIQWNESAHGNVGELSIYDLSGKVIKVIKDVDLHSSIQLTGIAKGNYLIQIKSVDSRVYYAKILIE